MLYVCMYVIMLQNKQEELHSIYTELGIILFNREALTKLESAFIFTPKRNKYPRTNGILQENILLKFARRYRYLYTSNATYIYICCLNLYFNPDHWCSIHCDIKQFSVNVTG